VNDHFTAREINYLNQRELRHLDLTLAVSSHQQPLDHPITAIVCSTPFRAATLSIAKAKVGFIEPMHALAVTVAARVFITLDEQQAHGQCR
jgi:hypothetical protein